jgi:hypothetical protein
MPASSPPYSILSRTIAQSQAYFNALLRKVINFWDGLNLRRHYLL